MGSNCPRAVVQGGIVIEPSTFVILRQQIVHTLTIALRKICKSEVTKDCRSFIYILHYYCNYRVS